MSLGSSKSSSSSASQSSASQSSASQSSASQSSASQSSAPQSSAYQSSASQSSASQSSASSSVCSPEHTTYCAVFSGNAVTLTGSLSSGLFTGTWTDSDEVTHTAELAWVGWAWGFSSGDGTHTSTYITMYRCDPTISYGSITITLGACATTSDSSSSTAGSSTGSASSSSACDCSNYVLGAGDFVGVNRDYRTGYDIGSSVSSRAPDDTYATVSNGFDVCDVAVIEFKMTCDNDTNQDPTQPKPSMTITLDESTSGLQLTWQDDLPQDGEYVESNPIIGVIDFASGVIAITGPVAPRGSGTTTVTLNFTPNANCITQIDVSGSCYTTAYSNRDLILRHSDTNLFTVVN